MLKREMLTDQIIQQLMVLKNTIEIKNQFGLYNDNIYAQDIICRLFNSAFGYELINLNRERITTAGIDLGDKKNRIAVQVTAENDSEKIKESIQQFIKNGYKKDYDRLIISILGKKKKYRTQFGTKDEFEFNASRDIIDFSDFASYAFYLELEKQQEILDILNDELCNSRQEPPQANETIGTFEKRIYAYCRAKLFSAGISDQLADKIIEDDIASDHYHNIIDRSNKGGIYLQGEYGSGKSHALCILTLRMIREYSSDPDKPFPLFVQAREIISAGGIQIWKEKQKEAKSYYIFIDGCDEMSIDETEKIIDEVFVLRSLWNNVHFILSGRPLPLLAGKDIVYEMQCLTTDQTIELISLVSGKDKIHISNHLRLTDSDLIETIKRPFFSLLYGVLLKQAGTIIRTSYSGIIEQFVNWTLHNNSADQDEIATILEKIAICSIDRNLGAVHISEFRNTDIYKALQRTGFLFLNRDNTVYFPLPVFAQWFAAQSILHKQVKVEEILNDETRASRWRYAFSLLFSQMTFEESLTYFSPIVRKDTGLVAEIITRGTINEYMHSSMSSYECGKMIRTCVDIWAEALGKLKTAVLPYDNNGIKKLAIYVDEGRITTTWSTKADGEDICVISPREQEQWRGTKRTCNLYAQSTWPWIYTFTLIKERLAKIINNREVLSDNIDIKQEYIWKTSLSLLNKGSLYPDSIPLAEVEKYRCFKENLLIHNGKKYILNIFFDLIDELYANGIEDISPSAPMGDKEYSNGFIWSNYSEQRMYERLTVILQKSLQAYADYVSGWFSSFASRMRMAILMPGVLHANLRFKEQGEGSDCGPVVSWHMEALPREMDNMTDITLNQSEEWQKSTDSLQSILKTDIVNRPVQKEWLGWILYSGGINCLVVDPITDTAFGWIEDDLKEIGWI